MLNVELLKNVLVIAIAGGCVSTLLIQKIKEILSRKNWLMLISFFVNLVIGTLFAKCFSDIEWIYCVWAGLFGFVDSTVLYAMLEDKIFKSFSSLNKDEEEVPNNEEEAVG